MKCKIRSLLVFLSAILFSMSSSNLSAQTANQIANSHLISPAELVQLQSKKAKPLLLHMGSHVLYSQAHIPGSEYVGPGFNEAGIQQLRKRVASLPRSKFIIVYCGCCPWNHCPNLKPADDTLAGMGFTNVKVLYIPSNFGADWVDRGYPVVSGD